MIKPKSKDDKPYYVLEIKDTSIKSCKRRENIFSLPLKLPMLCPPKPHGTNCLGGYLLNDQKFAENLIVPRKGYGLNSELEDANKVYNMVNKISSF